MRFETSQSMKMGQHMKLAPRMIQSMEILQMPLAELEERLEQELESNPTLEMVDGDAGSLDAPATQANEDNHAKENAEDFERLDSFEDSNPDAVENEFSDT